MCLFTPRGPSVSAASAVDKHDEYLENRRIGAARDLVIALFLTSYFGDDAVNVMSQSNVQGVSGSTDRDINSIISWRTTLHCSSVGGPALAQISSLYGRGGSTSRASA